LFRFFEFEQIAETSVSRSREFARAGHGFAPVPSVLEEQFRRQYGFAAIGPVSGVRGEFYVISVERKIKHPAIAVLTDNARRIFSDV
jgi:LysR family transcriptional regulator, transcriptional activator of nhaA